MNELFWDKYSKKEFSGAISGVLLSPMAFSQSEGDFEGLEIENEVPKTAPKAG